MVTDFLNEILTTLTEWISSILDLIQNAILKAFSLDLSTFHEFIPNAKDFYYIFVGIGIGIVILNFMWQSFKMMGLITGNEAEEPIPLVVKSVVYLILVGFAQDIFTILIDLGKVPYSLVINQNIALENPTISNLLDVLSVILVGSILPALPLVMFIIVVIIGINYLKLLLEIAERYIILAILQFIAPICIAFGSCKATKVIFDTYIRMLGGQILLLILHTWFLRMFLNMLLNAILIIELSTVILWVLFILGFLKTAQKLDSILAMLGFNTPKTGDTMLGEMILAGRMASGSLGKFNNMSKAGTNLNSVGNNNMMNTASNGFTGSIKRMADATYVGKGVNAIKQGQENKANNFSASAVTDSPTSSQIKNFDKGIHSGKKYAIQGIGNIANGSYKVNGSIKGNNAIKAMDTYFGNNEGTLNNNTSVKNLDNITPRATATKSTVEIGESVEKATNNVEIQSRTFNKTSIPIYSELIATNDNLDDSEQKFNKRIDNISNDSKIDNMNDMYIQGTENEITTNEHIDQNSTSIDEDIQGKENITTTDYNIRKNINTETNSLKQQNTYDIDKQEQFNKNITYEDIEIGGGKIRGFECNKNGEKTEFAMYSSDKFERPDTNYITEISKDGVKWYKQYAEPTLVKTPTGKFDKKDKAIMQETIEYRLPKSPNTAPTRK